MITERHTIACRLIMKTHTLLIISKSSALMHKKPIRLPSNFMLIVSSKHTN